MGATVVQHAWIPALVFAVVGACSGSSTTRFSPTPDAGGRSDGTGSEGPLPSGRGGVGAGGEARGGTSAGRSTGNAGRGGTLGVSGAGGEGVGEGGAAAVAGAGGDGPLPDCEGDDGIREGDVSASGDLGELLCVREVTGILSIELAPEAPAALELLQLVRGDLRISGPGRHEFSLPRLSRTGGLEISGVDALETLELPRLEVVTGGVHIAGNPLLSRLDWSALAEIGGDLVLGLCSGGDRLHCADNDVLTVVSLPALKSVGLLYIGGNPLLRQFDAPALERTDDIRIPGCAPVENEEWDLYGAELCTDLPQLDQLDLSALERAGEITLGPSGRDNPLFGTAGRVPLLRAARFPALVRASSITLRGLPALTSLDLPSLTTVESVWFDTETAALFVLDLPSLSSVERLDTLAPPIVLTAPALESASSIALSNVPDVPVSFPALTSLDSLNIGANGYRAFDCSVVLPNFSGDAWPSFWIKGDSLESVTCDSATKLRGVEIRSSALSSLSLPALTHVGALWLDADALPTLPLPELRTAGTLGVISALSLTSVDLPLFETAQHVSIWNTALTRLDLPQLETVEDTFTLDFRPGITIVALDSLTTVRTLDLFGGSPIESLSLPALTTVDTLSLGRHAVLTEFSAPLLGPSMTSLGLYLNPLLALPALPSLTSVETLAVVECPSISQCEVDTWAASLSASCDCRDNGVCGP
jgi:hypothetical protein